MAKYKIRFSDVDAARIFYYPRFFYLCHQAFEDFFNEKSSWSYDFLINERALGFPTVNITSDFLKPILFGDTAHVQLCVKKIGNSSLTCGYEIYTKNPKELNFKAEIITACADLLHRRSMPIPDDVKNFLSENLNLYEQKQQPQSFRTL